ncbi:hypothetical protein HYQ45_007946 [Verticillium longisporum]|uniref:Uncharacterized protein n=1 Tax=Verticillium longisporum TaxID=100787 RepID=A0A8I3APP0_VERLO|nr:hypothetical protein HYQ45_007946 [Verticillium longisporum]
MVFGLKTFSNDLPPPSTCMKTLDPGEGAERDKLLASLPEQITLFVLGGVCHAASTPSTRPSEPLGITTHICRNTH